MTRMAKALVAVLAVAAGAGTGFAKGATTKIIITSPSLAAPIVITDSTVVSRFNVWSGRGTTSTGGPHTMASADQFIVDWGAGEVSKPSQALRRYEIRFFVRERAQDPDTLAYVVVYETRDKDDGYVYFPGPSDSWYQLNVRAIFRGVEGKWFRASDDWQSTMRDRLPAGR